MPGPEKNDGSFQIETEEDEEGNLILPFPEELLDALGWKGGDVLEVYTVCEQIVFRKVGDRSSTDDGIS